MVYCLLATFVSLLPFGATAKAMPVAKLSSPVDCNLAGFETMLSSSPNRESANAVSTKLPARAYWLNRQLLKWPGVNAAGNFRLYHSANGSIIATQGAAVQGADGGIDLAPTSSLPSSAVLARFKYIPDGTVLAVAKRDVGKIPALLKQQLVLVQEDATGVVPGIVPGVVPGVVLNATTLQIAGALDDVYSSAKNVDDLGVTVAKTSTQFKLWAPTARSVSVCVYESGTSKAIEQYALQENALNGIWSHRNRGDLSNKYYKYFVDVYVNGVGLIRNAVTDPYSVSLTTDSKRSYIAHLNAANLKPEGWDKPRRSTKVASATDMVIYELHVRDFSINDATVSAANRGKYLAFTEAGSNGMKHLEALADAGMTDIHLLPVFDISTVPESGCVPGLAAPGILASDYLDSEVPQAVIAAVADKDCFNWGYDPFHFSALEGSYATDAADGARRILEFRQMVAALHQAGLRVGMDVVYNHTFQSGQKEKSVLDRIVPGYYHRLNAEGAVEQSTCCENTATEHMMMGKLMIDSTMLWAKQYQIDSFRFDLMGHQPRAVMLALQQRVNRAAGRDVQLIGEGWNFAEVADGKRFEQASQLSLNGSGIGTFSDRARDAVRGGGAGDSGTKLVTNQGYINGLFYDPNESADKANSATSLLRAADMVRIGLAGSIRDYVMQTFDDSVKPLSAIDYSGQPAGYASQPSEVVNYVDNHDNQTLFDINAYRLPLTTSTEDRARVQMLGVATTAFSQGIAYFHAGIDTLRSKSMDGNSYDSGDWFNRLDWTYTDNYFGTGAPQKKDNEAQYAFIKPRLANALIKPTPKDIALARDMFRDLLRIRASSAMFRLTSAADAMKRLQFFNTGSKQNPVLIVGHLNGVGLAGANFNELMYFINVDKTLQTITLPTELGKAYVLHPIHLSKNAADKRPAEIAAYDRASGSFTIPARTALVYVVSTGERK